MQNVPGISKEREEEREELRLDIEHGRRLRSDFDYAVNNIVGGRCSLGDAIKTIKLYTSKLQELGWFVTEEDILDSEYGRE